MLATAVPPGFGLPRSHSSGQSNGHRVPLRTPGVMHPNTISLLEQQAVMAGGYNNVNARVGTANEEISTIFVVGFPEDMQEREFQNMFIFSSGFEAATLKIPNYNQDELDINGSMNNSRKQIIGFAKFRTRLEALEARDIISGRKVDAEKGSVLKAEMAKKNLHTKRGLSNDQYHGHLLLSQAALASRKQYHGASSAYDAFYSVPACAPPLPSDLLSSPQDFAFDYPYGAGIDQYSGINAGLADGQYNVAAAQMHFVESSQNRVGGLVMAQRSQSLENIESAAAGQLQQHQHGQQGQQKQQAAGNCGVQSDPLSAPLSRLGSMKSLLDLPDVTKAGHREVGGRLGSRSLSDLCSLPQSAPAAAEARGFNSALFGSIAKPDPTGQADDFGGLPLCNNITAFPSGAHSGGFSGRFAPLQINAAAANSFQHSMVFPATATGVISPGIRTANPGDQNPPCNTLYVGNLPANTNEEELRHLFSKCAGYKRMCFRTKANGPMCFVEFEDVTCATQALHDLHGNQLSNSVKGGIRLSYSKNPLGVRQHHFPAPVAFQNNSCIPGGALGASALGTFCNPTTPRDVMAGGTVIYGGVFHDAPFFPTVADGLSGYASSLHREGMNIEDAYGVTGADAGVDVGAVGDPVSPPPPPPQQQQQQQAVTLVPPLPGVSSCSSSANNLTAGEGGVSTAVSSNLASSSAKSSGNNSPNPIGTPAVREHATNLSTEHSTDVTAVNSNTVPSSCSPSIAGGDLTGQDC